MLQILILYSTDTDLADKDTVIEWLTARVAEQEHTTRVLHRTPPTPRPGIVGMLPTSHPVTSLHILMPVSRTDLPTASAHPLLHAPAIPVHIYSIVSPLSLLLLWQPQPSPVFLPHH